MSIIEMKMLRWIYGETWKGKINNEHIREQVHQWFGYVQCSIILAFKRKSLSIQVDGSPRIRKL